MARTTAEWKEGIGHNNADAILTFVKALKKLKITSCKCADGAEILGFMNRLGIKPEKTKTTLELINGDFGAAGVDPSLIGNLLLQLVEVSHKTNTPLDKVPDLLQELIQEQEAISNHIRQLKKQEEEEAKELQRILDEKGLVIENILSYVEVEKQLNPLGLTLLDMPKTINVVKNVTTLDFDPIKVAEFYSSIDSIAKKQEELRTQVEAKEARIKELDSDAVNIQKSIDDLNAVKKPLDDLVSLGFNEILMKQLIEKLKQAAQDNSLPFHVAAGHFIRHIIAHYDNIVGFENTLKFLEQQMNQTNQKLKNIQDEYEQTQTAHAQFTDALNSLQLLTSMGVRNKDILYWQAVFHDHPSLQPSVLTASLKEYGDIQEALVGLQSKYEAMKKQLQTYEIEKEVATKEKMRLTQEIDNLKKIESEERSRYQAQEEKARRDYQEHLKEISIDIIHKSTKAAFMAALDLKARSSPLLPIVKFENGGPEPDQDELMMALIYLIRMLIENPSSIGPLRTQLENILALIYYVQGSSRNKSSNIGNIAAGGNNEGTKVGTESEATAVSNSDTKTTTEKQQPAETDPANKDDGHDYTGVFRNV